MADQPVARVHRRGKASGRRCRQSRSSCRTCPDGATAKGTVPHLVQGNEVRLDTADAAGREREDVAVGESMALTALARRLAIADGDDGVVLFDEPIDGQGGAAHELVVLDLLIERVLAREMFVSREIPDDVVGQAPQDLFVIAAAEPIEVRLDDILAS